MLIILSLLIMVFQRIPLVGAACFKYLTMLIPDLFIIGQLKHSLNRSFISKALLVLIYCLGGRLQAVRTQADCYQQLHSVWVEVILHMEGELDQHDQFLWAENSVNCPRIKQTLHVYLFYIPDYFSPQCTVIIYLMENESALKYAMRPQHISFLSVWSGLVRQLMCTISSLLSSTQVKHGSNIMHVLTVKNPITL